MVVIFILTINSNFSFLLQYFYKFKVYKLCATRLSKIETMERLVTKIAVESKIYFPSIKNKCICYKNCPKGYCQILQVTCKAGAKGSYKLQSPSEVLSLAFNECKLHLSKCLLHCVYRRRHGIDIDWSKLLSTNVVNISLILAEHYFF